MRKMTSLALAITVVPAFAVATVSSGERENPPAFHLAQNDTQIGVSQPLPPGGGEDYRQQPEQDLEQQIQQDPEELLQEEEQLNQEQQEQASPEVDVERPEAPQAGTQAQDQMAQEASGIMAMQARDLEGRTVYNQDGQDIGNVQHFARHGRTDELHVVIDIGDFLGIGSSYIALPIDEMTARNNQLLLRTDRTGEQIEQDTEEYDAENFSQVDSGLVLQQAQQNQ